MQRPRRDVVRDIFGAKQQVRHHKREKVKMKRIAMTVAFGLLLVVLAVTKLACGGDIEGTEQPELQVENPQLDLPQMAPDDRSRSFSNSLVLRNVGHGDLQVNSIRWVDRPNRVEAYHGDALECSDDTDCGSQGSCVAGQCHCTATEQCPDNAVCLTQSNQCRASGFRTLPETVRHDATFSHNLIVVDDDEPVTCPEPNSSDAPSGYCGAIEVETNAPNSDDQIQNGTATVYLIADEGSGMLQLPDTFVEFKEAEPGKTQLESFEVVNGAPSDLHFNEITFSSNPTWFNVSPPPHEITVEGNQSEWITIEMTPPSDATEEDLTFMSGVTFNTSSITSEPSLTVSVTPGIGDAPIIEVDPMQLSFEDDLTQTLIVYNHGLAALPLNSMQIRPPGSDAVDAYDVLYEGESVMDLPDGVQQSSVMPTVSPGDYEEFTVVFDPAQVEESAIGVLRIGHYPSLGEVSTDIDLLGESSSVPLGEVSPRQVYFRSDQDEGEEQERVFAVINNGNDDLVVNDVELVENPSVGTTNLEYFEVEGLDAGSSIGVGEIEEFTLVYSGSTEMEQGLTVQIDSNHAGASSEMRVNVSAVPLTEPTMEIAIDPSFPENAQVGEAATFEVTDSSGQGELSLATWTLHERPAGSEALIQGGGEEVSIVPDVAGQYRISVTVRDSSNRQVQEMFSFNAQ